MAIYARRHNPRFRLKEVAYINFAPGSRALVFDVCEAGLRFKTSDPLPQCESIKFSLASGEESEATADLTWIDESRTTGGLSFKSVPPGVTGQIRAWIDHSRELPQTFRRPRNPAMISDLPIETGDASPPAKQPMEKEPNKLEAPKTLSTAQANHDPEAIKWDRSATKKKENRLSIFGLKPTPLGRHMVEPTRRSFSTRRLVGVTIVILIFLGAATAAAGYFYPNEEHSALLRAQTIVTRSSFAAARALHRLSNR
jgi:hypothetical protein